MAPEAGVIGDKRGSGRRHVFGAIRRAGRIARVDLARRTGISPATVSAITAELIEAGLIEETAPGPAGEGDVRRGRPRVDLKVRGAARLVAGIKLSHESLTVALCDFEGQLVGDGHLALTRSCHEVEALIPLLSRAVADTTGDAGLSAGDLAGIGLGLAGTVDAARGTVHWSPNIAERNIDLRARLTAALGLPVFVDNDTNSVAMAELHFGHGRGVANFVVLTIESGVGMGLVIDHELYRGARGCGGEIGHSKVQLDGALCRCGQRGCLEAYVADYALLRDAETVMDLPEAGTQRRLQALIDAAEAGKAPARRILERAGRMLALGIANIVNIFDPELVILSGERMQFDTVFAGGALDSYRGAIVQVDAAPPGIVIHKWGDLMWARGAAAYAVEGVADIALREIAGDAA